MTLAVGRMQERHFSDHLAGAESANHPPIGRYLDKAVNNHAKLAVIISFADHGHFLRQFPPDADAQHLPQLDVLELGEERQVPQALEVCQILLRLILFLHLVAHGCQVLGELGAIAVAAVEIFLQCFPDDRVEAGWQTRPQRADRRRVHVDDLVDQSGGVVGTKRQPSGQQLEQQYAQRVEVGLVVQRIVLDLLG